MVLTLTVPGIAAINKIAISIRNSLYVAKLQTDTNLIP